MTTSNLLVENNKISKNNAEYTNTHPKQGIFTFKIKYFHTMSTSHFDGNIDFFR